MRGRLYTAILQHVVLVRSARAVCVITATQLRDRTDNQGALASSARPNAPPSANPGLISLTRTPDDASALASYQLTGSALGADRDICLTRAVRSPQAAKVKGRITPSGSAEFRSSTASSCAAASMQAPPSHRLLLRHSALLPKPDAKTPSPGP